MTITWQKVEHNWKMGCYGDLYSDVGVRGPIKEIVIDDQQVFVRLHWTACATSFAPTWELVGDVEFMATVRDELFETEDGTLTFYPSLLGEGVEIYTRAHPQLDPRMVKGHAAYDASFVAPSTSST